MASCEFSKYVGGDCGASLVLPSGDLCVRISECSKDIKGHLKTYGVSDGTLCSEATLLLARAGKSNSIRVSPLSLRNKSNILISLFAQDTAMHLVLDGEATENYVVLQVHGLFTEKPM